MRSLLTGMVVGALAITAISNSKNSSKSMLKKGRRVLMKKIDNMLNI